MTEMELLGGFTSIIGRHFWKLGGNEWIEPKTSMIASTAPNQVLVFGSRMQLMLGLCFWRWGDFIASVKELRMSMEEVPRSAVPPA
jgi:hypothetical protein